MFNVFLELTETQRQAVAEGLRLLMEQQAPFVCEEEKRALTANDLADLIEEVLNA